MNWPFYYYEVSLFVSNDIPIPSLLNSEMSLYLNCFFSPRQKIVKYCFLKKMIYFNWRLVTLQYGDGFWHTLRWISHGCTCVSSSWNPSSLPPHPIPLGCPSALAFSTLFHASNLDWSSISHMVIYMFQCYSFISHPCLLPHSPKVCSLHLCLFCCLAYRIVITVFLNSIYMC